MLAFVVAIGILACTSFPAVNSFQGAQSFAASPRTTTIGRSIKSDDVAVAADGALRRTNYYSSRLFESSSSSSAASKWMENEKRLEEELEAAAAVAADEEQQVAATIPTSSTTNEDETTTTTTNNTSPPSPPGRWEELHGNYILRPPNNEQQPRALLHFLGGALLGAAPQLSYRYMLERLSSRGYLIVATPYQLSFDHLGTCDEIIGRFERVAPALAKEYGAVPVVGVGHSCGSLLHMLITSLFPDTPRAANALISYNNRGVGEAVPFFEELIVPLFSDKDRNGSELMKALIQVSKEQFNGKVPSDESLLQLLQSTLSPIPGIGPILTESFLKTTPSLISIPPPIRTTLTNMLTEPTYNALSNMGLPSLLLSSLDITQQIPKLIDEVEQGARDFVPTPEAMSSAARRAYRCRRTLLLQFDNDNLDDSEILEGYLKEAESVMKMKRPMITIDLQRKVLEGNHVTPLLGPSGGEGWGEVLEESLGGVFDVVGGIGGGGGGSGSSEPEVEGGSGDVGSSSSSAKAVREKLGYDQVERVVDELAAWLDEGSL